MLAFSVIGLTIALLVLVVRLGDAQRQLAEARRESAEQACRAREEEAACRYGIAVACLLAGLGATHRHVPPTQPRAARFKAGAGMPWQESNR